MAFEGEISRNLFSGKRKRAENEAENIFCVIIVQGRCPDIAADGIDTKHCCGKKENLLPSMTFDLPFIK
jgi:hypothetical protein